MHENIMCRSRLFLSLVLMYEVNADRLLGYPDSNQCTQRQPLCDVYGGHYHCLLDHKGRLGEWCLDKLQMIESMKCPYYNINGNLDARPCREMYSSGCPQKEYDSNQSYMYSDCLQPEKSVATTTQIQKQHTTSESPLITNVTLQPDYHSTTTEDTIEVLFDLQESHGEKENPDQRLNLILTIMVSVLGFCSIAAIIMVAVFIYRKRREKQTSSRIDEEKAMNRRSNSSDGFGEEKGKSFKDSLLPNHH